MSLTSTEEQVQKLALELLEKETIIDQLTLSAVEDAVVAHYNGVVKRETVHKVVYDLKWRDLV